MNSKIQQLDSIRAIAASYVMVGHWGGEYFKNTSYELFFKFGQEAVMAFFILSGFVIYLSFNNKPNITFGEYFLKRFRRIYFPVFCAYIISGIIYYLANQALDLSWSQVIGNLLMLQDFGAAKPGNWIDPLFNNGPLWSLSYEWWFYILFFPIMRLYQRVKRKVSIYHILLLSGVFWLFYLISPNHGSLVITYLIIWWSGVEAAKIYLRYSTFTFKNTVNINISLLSLVFLGLIPLLLPHYEVKTLGIFPLLMLRHFISALVLFNLGLLWYKFKLKGFRYLYIFNWLAPMSYALYVIHRPILTLEFSEFLILDIMVKLIIILGLSYLIEVILQPKFNLLLKHNP